MKIGVKQQSVRRGGFTRVEAVAVVGVAGAVAALVVPAAAQGTILDLIFGRGVVGSETASCQSNLKQLGLGLIQYAQDYDELYPPATTKTREYGWGGVIQPYVKSVQLFQCPTEKHKAEDDEALSRTEFNKANYSDYWLSSKLSGQSQARIAAPSESLAMGDGDGGSAASTARYTIARLPQSWLQTPGSPALRHVLSLGQGANYAFADGHVRWLKPVAIANGSASLAKSGGKPTFAIQ